MNGDVNGSTEANGNDKAQTPTKTTEEIDERNAPSSRIPESQKTLVDKNNIYDDDDDNNDNPVFDNLAARAAICLLESELRRDAKGEHTKTVASSVTNWINDATAFALQKTFDKVKLKVRLVNCLGWF